MTIAETDQEFSGDRSVSSSHEVKITSFRDVPWRGSDAAVGLFPLVVHRVAPFVIGPVDLTWQPFVVMFWVPLSLIPFAWMIAYPLWMARRRGYAGPRWPGFRAAVTDIALALVIMPVALMVIDLLTLGSWFLLGDSARPGLTHEPIYRSSNANALALSVLVVIVAPFTEELFFRGLLYNALRRRLPIFLAIPLQSLVFAGLHPFELVNLAIIAATGCVLGGIYEWRKTLIAPIACHMAQNLLAALVIIYSASIAGRSTAEASGSKVGDMVQTIDQQAIESRLE